MKHVKLNYYGSASGPDEDGEIKLINRTGWNPDTESVMFLKKEDIEKILSLFDEVK